MKVSKNIKKLRTEKNISQEALAEKLFVSRTAVSSWETGRTQPDIETLTKIAEIFETDIETLIYGEKRFTKEKDYTKSRKKLITVIFSVLATVSVSAGLILIFITGWKMLPDTAQCIFSLLPAIIGQIFAFFVFRKKHENPIWSECAGFFWSAGIFASVSLLNTVFNSGSELGNCLILISALILPIVYVFDAVIPLAVYYICLCLHSASFFTERHNNFALGIAIHIILLIAGALYPIIKRKNKEKPQFIFSVRFTLIAVSVQLYRLSYLIFSKANGSIFFSLIIIAAFAVVLFIFENGKIKTAPFENISFIILSVTSCFSAYITQQKHYITNAPLIFSLLIAAAITASAALPALAICRKHIKKDNLRFAFFLSTLFYLFSATVALNVYNPVFCLISVAASLTMSVLITVMGVMRTNFRLLNTGLITTVAVIFISTAQIIDRNMLAGGIMLLLIGLTLFAVNFALTKKIKNSEKEENRNEEK